MVRNKIIKGIFIKKEQEDPIKILESIAKNGKKAKKYNHHSYESQIEERWEKSNDGDFDVIKEMKRYSISNFLEKYN